MQFCPILVDIMYDIIMNVIFNVFSHGPRELVLERHFEPVSNAIETCVNDKSVTRIFVKPGGALFENVMDSIHYYCICIDSKF